MEENTIVSTNTLADFITKNGLTINPLLKLTPSAKPFVTFYKGITPVLVSFSNNTKAELEKKAVVFENETPVANYIGKAVLPELFVMEMADADGVISNVFSISKAEKVDALALLGL